jgi:hypothetical protein
MKVEQSIDEGLRQLAQAAKKLIPNIEGLRHVSAQPLGTENRDPRVM